VECKEVVVFEEVRVKEKEQEEQKE